MDQSISFNIFEISGTIAAFAYLYLSVRENIWLWPVGFLSSFFFLVFFFQESLYAGMGLQLYYMVISIYGWFHWLGSKTGSTVIKTRLPTVSISLPAMLVSILAITGLTFTITGLLKWLPAIAGLPPSTLPLGDAFVTAGGIVATWMLAKKILENWLVWIVVNMFAVGMYIYNDMVITAALFFVYMIMAFLGYARWKKQMRK